MERLGIFAALAWECRPILRQLRGVTVQEIGECQVWHGTTATREIWLTKTGVGNDHARRAAISVINPNSFDCVVSTGCAGALASHLTPGALVVASTVLTGKSGDRHDTHPAYQRLAEAAAERAGLVTTNGPLLCSARPIGTASAKAAAGTTTGALAVEMEGAPIGARAAEVGIPFLAVRSILDTAETELSGLTALIDRKTGGVKPVALAVRLATQPRTVPRVVALHRMRSAAERALKTFFAALFATPAPDTHLVSRPGNSSRSSLILDASGGITPLRCGPMFLRRRAWPNYAPNFRHGTLVDPCGFTCQVNDLSASTD